MTKTRLGFAAMMSMSLVVSAAPVRAADEIHWTIVAPTTVTFDWRGSETQIRYGLTPAPGYNLNNWGNKKQERTEQGDLSCPAKQASAQPLETPKVFPVCRCDCRQRERG